MRTLYGHLREKQLQVFLDEREIESGDNWVLKLSDAIEASRYLVLVLSPESIDRPWLVQEWTSFLARSGPTGRILPVLLAPVSAKPSFLDNIHHIDARDRDAERVANQLARLIGPSATLSQDDSRRLTMGQELIFTLKLLDRDQLQITNSDGKKRVITPPWRQDNRFGNAHLFYDQLTRKPMTDDKSRVELHQRARTLGELLFGVLFETEKDLSNLQAVMIPGQRPLVVIQSESDFLLSLPWELLYHDDQFLLKEARLDLCRTTPDNVSVDTLLSEPAEAFKLVVNVSAPRKSKLNYEGESYRISRALSEQCPFTPTELGTLEDLIQTSTLLQQSGPEGRPQTFGIHFSGHGEPGALVFEDDFGESETVPVKKLLSELRTKLPGTLPPFFYLASCHGNTPAATDKAKAGSESSAAVLHREGISQVVGYYGPIGDELSTRAEEALYAAVSDGHSTRHAVRLARQALAQPLDAPDAKHRVTRGQAAISTHPFAWAQLVFYHRGPEQSLSVKIDKGERSGSLQLERAFEDPFRRRRLKTGFIGRRTDLHRVRRLKRDGQRVYVFQGLGGLGKTTLALEVLSLLGPRQCVLWCQEIEGEENPTEALVAQLLKFCREIFGADWEQVVFRVDRTAGSDSVKRFQMHLSLLAEKLPGLVLYFDNLESLLQSPKTTDKQPTHSNDRGQEIGPWENDGLAQTWQFCEQLATGQQLYLVASTRYRNPDLEGGMIPVSSMSNDGLFRMMEWFPSLRRLSVITRTSLVDRLEGHPRAVEFLDDLIGDALIQWKKRKGTWQIATTPAAVEVEWQELVKPALPQVEARLWDDLLLQQIWDRVLDRRARRMLYRMALVQTPWVWSLMEHLGEIGESPEKAQETAEFLTGTSLVEQLEIFNRSQESYLTHYTMHPATRRFVQQTHGGDKALDKESHRRIGNHLEKVAKDSLFLEDGKAAGHHLFEAEEYDRAYQVLGTVSNWLRQRGRAREGLAVLDPFLTARVRGVLEPVLAGRMLGTLGLAHYRLAEVEKSISYYEQALAISREIGDRQGESNSLGSLGNAYASLGEVEKAISCHEQALVISREIGDRQGEGSDLGNLGNAYASLGEVEKSISYDEQALVISREIGDHQGEGNHLGSLGNAYLRLGEVEKAISYHEQALVIFREIGRRRGEGNSLGNLGTAYLRLGEVKKAISYLEQALVISREIGDRRGEGNSLGSLGNAYARLGEVEKAISCHEQALVISREIGDRQGEGNRLGNLGYDYLRLGEVEKAISYHEQALVISREIGDRQGEGNKLGNLGYAYARLGEVEKARGLLTEALRIGQEVKDPRIVAVSRRGLQQLK